MNFSFMALYLKHYGFSIDCIVSIIPSLVLTALNFYVGVILFRLQAAIELEQNIRNIGYVQPIVYDIEQQSVKENENLAIFNQFKSNPTSESYFIDDKRSINTSSHEPLNEHQLVDLQQTDKIEQILYEQKKELKQKNMQSEIDKRLKEKLESSNERIIISERKKKIKLMWRNQY